MTDDHVDIGFSLASICMGIHVKSTDTNMLL